MIDAKMKTFNIGTIKMGVESNGCLKGFALKRDLTVRECKHILGNLLGYNLNTLEDCYDKEDYRNYNKDIANNVNQWLRGNADDWVIEEYAYDCDDNIGVMNLIPVIAYLKKKKIID